MQLIKTRSFIRFIATGVLATTLHFIIALSLINYDLTSVQIANGIAFFLTSTISYFINTLWSFSCNISPANFWKYFAVSTVGFFLSYVTATVSGLFTRNSVLVIFSVAIFVPPLVYLLHQKITYNDQRQS